MVLLEVIHFIRVENRFLPWWRQFPEQWGYPLQTLLCLGLLVLWRRRYPPLNRRGVLVGAVMGLVGIGLWLVPPLLHHFAGLGETTPWLAALGVQARLDGFEPGAVFGADDFPWTHRLVIAMRFLRLVLVVPLIEELFWPGFLMRFLTGREIAWEQFPLGQCDRRSVLLTALAFACVHAGPDFVPALIFGGLAGAVARSTGNLWAVVLMHAVANLCLGIFIMRTEWWGLW